MFSWRYRQFVKTRIKKLLATCCFLAVCVPSIFSDSISDFFLEIEAIAQKDSLNNLESFLMANGWSNDDYEWWSDEIEVITTKEYKLRDVSVLAFYRHRKDLGCYDVIFRLFEGADMGSVHDMRFSPQDAYEGAKRTFGEPSLEIDYAFGEEGKSHESSVISRWELPSHDITFESHTLNNWYQGRLIFKAHVYSSIEISEKPRELSELVYLHFFPKGYIEYDLTDQESQKNSFVLVVDFNRQRILNIDYYPKFQITEESTGEINASYIDNDGNVSYESSIQINRINGTYEFTFLRDDGSRSVQHGIYERTELSEQQIF